MAKGSVLVVCIRALESGVDGVTPKLTLVYHKQGTALA